MKEKNDYAKDKIRYMLEMEIVEPFIDSVCSNIDNGSLKLSSAFFLTLYTERIVENSFMKMNSCNHRLKELYLLLKYFGKIYRSSLISLGATDYLSSIILMRSLFELLIGISTNKNGSMKDRIKSINFFDEKEKKI